MSFSPLIDTLIKSFRCLPGVGTKTAQRMAFHLLERNRDGGKQLAATLDKAMESIGHCQRCRTFCETTLCDICVSQKRNPDILCIVESPADIVAIEQSSSFFGYYFVLMGHLSPLDGIGPDDIGIPLLKQRLAKQQIKECILATNATVEGEATAYFLGQIVRHYKINVSRIAHGIPKGSELEYIDSGTLADALAGRSEFALEESF